MLLSFMLWHIVIVHYFDYCSICQCVNNTWFIHPVFHSGCLDYFQFFAVMINLTQVSGSSCASVSLGFIPRAYECSNIEGHRQCHLSSSVISPSFPTFLDLSNHHLIKPTIFFFPFDELVVWEY